MKRKYVDGYNAINALHRLGIDNDTPLKFNKNDAEWNIISKLLKVYSIDTANKAYINKYGNLVSDVFVQLIDERSVEDKTKTKKEVIDLWKFTIEYHKFDYILHMKKIHNDYLNFELF